MKVKVDKNIVLLDGCEIVLPNDVHSVIEYENYFVILLMDNEVPDNNIYAYSYTGECVWNISDIIKFPYAEAYVSVGKPNDNILSVVSYNGVNFLIDTLLNAVIEKDITK